MGVKPITTPVIKRTGRSIGPDTMTEEVAASLEPRNGQPQPQQMTLLERIRPVYLRGAFVQNDRIL